jgi:ring-1,2-phenylacetyl-CoA epoxidase subunit PaaD
MVTDTMARVADLVADVPDPELPVITIGQLGILRSVDIDKYGAVVVTVTPTYSGCPAMDAIRDDIRARLREEGLDDVEVRTQLAPPWTTDWISPEGKEALRRNGIAPPSSTGVTRLALSVRCPRCGSFDTQEISHFGSTACKAIYRCAACVEPFDQVKPI